MPSFDVAVIGLGAMGAAALYHLSQRQVRAIGIEQYEPGHDHGSSHGATRIIRLAYFEHPSYVPLVRAAIPLWRELEQRTGERLLHVTGIIEIGAPESELIKGTLQASREHNLPHEILSAEEVMRRVPAFHLPSHYVGVFQPDGGYVSAEPSILAHLKLAAAEGAEIKTNTKVHSIEPTAHSVRVHMSDGIVEAGQVIIAAGPWLKNLVPALANQFRVTRQVISWFEPENSGLFTSDSFPVFLIENETSIYYGFPIQKEGLKFAKHHHLEEAAEPNAPVPTPSNHDEAILRTALSKHLPAANGALLKSKTCFYTVTPDGDFLIDRLPNNSNIIVASPCSGHGFKFSPVIGEILADLATAGASRHDISRFRMSRFSFSA